MGEIADFNCTYDNSAGIHKEVTDKLNLNFPEAYKHWNTMALLAKELKVQDGASFCELPFCHTVEGEAMGGMVNYGDALVGPRAKEYICTTVEELLALPEIDYDRGRIQEVLKACAYLREQGEHVVLEIAGPFTILNVLMDARHVFKIMRKQPEQMKKVFDKFEAELLRYVEEAVKYGVDMISYADSSGGVNILGPKIMKEVTEQFTYPFLQKAEAKLNDRTIIQLCPKTTLALIGTGQAKFYDIPLTGAVEYGEACTQVIGRAKFVGQMCIKNIHYVLKNQRMKAVELL